MNENEIIREDGRLSTKDGQLIGWVATDGRFHPCGTALTAGQLLEILKILGSV